MWAPIYTSTHIYTSHMYTSTHKVWTLTPALTEPWALTLTAPWATKIRTLTPALTEPRALIKADAPLL